MPVFVPLSQPHDAAATADWDSPSSHHGGRRGRCRVSKRGPDFYALLGVAPDADAREIARAYRRRLREVHPDTRDRLADRG